jgi:ATP-dependent protease Clp ATPase subunit
MKRDKLISQSEQIDVIKFGMVPELVGRFPVLVPFHSLSRADLVRVLSEPKNSLVAQKKHEFAMDGVSLFNLWIINWRPAILRVVHPRLYIVLLKSA